MAITTTHIPDQYRDLLDNPVTVALVTVMPDGQPQATPVWCDYLDGMIRVNTAAGRQKDRNLQADPKVTILAIDPTNPYRWMEVRGQIVARTLEGAEEHIDALTMQYMNKPKFDRPADEVRVMYLIEPLRVNANG